MISVFKCRPDAMLPSYATRFSACFDLHAHLANNSEVKVYNSANEIVTRGSIGDYIILHSGDRALIPTGLKFNIPPCSSIRLHPRSGLSFKSGLMLTNCEGVIDEDYCEEVFVSLFNASQKDVRVYHGDRICQAELVKDSRAVILETFTAPYQKTDRIGGFGSTGK